MTFWAVAIIAVALFGYSPTGTGCGTYISASGTVVKRPCGNWLIRTAPNGATARCRDGTFSFSQHPRYYKTCSHHWGVASYL